MCNIHRGNYIYITRSICKKNVTKLVESAEIKLTYQRNFLLHNLTVNYELKVITRLVLLSGEYVPLYSLTFTLSILDMVA